MKNTLIKATIAATMVMGMQAGLQIGIHADEIAVQTNTILPDGTYTIASMLMNASNIVNPSMAGGALKETGKLLIENGKWYVIAEFKTLDFGGAGSVYGNASQIKYYTNYQAKEALGAEVISMRNDAKVTTENGILENQEAVKEVKIPVEVHAQGVYISLFVDFMNYAPDAYIKIDTKDCMKQALQNVITQAKAYQKDEYTTASFTALNEAIMKAERMLSGTDEEIFAQITAVNNAVTNLTRAYQLANGTYRVDASVLKADSDMESMAASAVKAATLKAVDGSYTVSLDMGSVSMMGATAFIDRLEYELSDGTYKAADITKKDEAGNVAQVRFMLPSNGKITNVKFYYGGSSRGAVARLSLALDKATPITISKFADDGTYHMQFQLWHAINDVASMAAGAFEDQATIVVKDGKATMYVATKKMTMGSITAYLQTLKIMDDQNAEAVIVSKDSMNNPTAFSFHLPHEETYLNVLVNPMVAIMGNQDIAARMKMDYNTLTKVSDATQAPTFEQNNEDSNHNTESNEANSTPAPDTTNTETNTATGTNANAVNATSIKQAVVETGDRTDMSTIGGVLLSSFVAGLYLIKKRLCK